MAYQPGIQLKANLDALRVALSWQPGNLLSEADAQVLKQYSGFGGIKAILYPVASRFEWKKLNATPGDMRLYDGIMELHRMVREALPEEAYKVAIQSLRNSVLTAF